MMYSAGIETCKLCGSGTTLRKSHIVPKFVGRWLKETSPTPYLRFGGNMDGRLQDLYAMELLCDDCEMLFSEWETKFATEIFYPSADGATSFRCGPWLVKFAASLAWRAIQYCYSKNIEEFSPAMESMVDGMEVHLSRFLLAQEKHVGSYTQHLYPVSELAVPMEPGSPMMSRYLARTVQIDFLRNDDLSEMLVYVKLPMFMFFSIGESKYRKWFETGRIKKSSVIQPRGHGLPGYMRDYLLNQSDKLSGLMNSMSEKSKEVADKALHKAIEKDPDGVMNSRLMQAMMVDYLFYGKDAVVFRD